MILSWIIEGRIKSFGTPKHPPHYPFTLVVSICFFVEFLILSFVVCKKRLKVVMSNIFQLNVYGIFNHFATTKAQKNVWACLPVKVNRIEGTTFILCNI